MRSDGRYNSYYALALDTKWVVSESIYNMLSIQFGR